MIRHAIDHLAGEMEDLFRVTDPKRWRTALLLPLLQALPFQIRELFDQLFHLLVVLNRFPDAPFPLPRHKQLAQLSPLPSNQVEAGMEFSPSAVTTGFAAADVSQGEGAARRKRAS